MHYLLPRLSLAVVLAAASPVQAFDKAAPIPEGRAYACAYTKGDTKVNDKLVTNPKDKFDGASGVITADEAYHCTRARCYRFVRSPSLSQTSQVYLDESDGTRLITNAVALEFDGGILIERSLSGGAIAVTILSGHCREMAQDKLLEMLKTLSKAPPKSKR